MDNKQKYLHTQHLQFQLPNQILHLSNSQFCTKLLEKICEGDI